MIAQSRAESTRDTYNYGQYLNQFPPNTIKVIREFERIQKKICRHKMSIMFNEICINEEMLPKYTYIYIYIYIYIYMKKIEKVFQMWWIYYDVKSTLKRFSLINLHQDFKMVKNVAITPMDVLIK